MIRGGRDKILQERSLLKVLPRLAELNLLTQTQVETLHNAYIFYRQIENVLQAIDDKQTQTLPTDEASQARLVFACQSYYQQDLYSEKTHWVEHSFNDWQQFMAVLSQYHKQYARFLMKLSVKRKHKPTAIRLMKN